MLSERVRVFRCVAQHTGLAKVQGEVRVMTGA
jgi:hypothetical protein